MRIILSLGALFFAAHAFSFSPIVGTEYRSEGSWKHVSGDEGSWTSVMMVSQVENSDSFQIAETTTIVRGEETYQMSDAIVSRSLGNGFYEILRNDEVIGRGYCMDSTCHMEYLSLDEEEDSAAPFKHGGHLEETMHFAGNQIMRIGSHHHGEDWVSFDGVATPMEDQK